MFNYYLKKLQIDLNSFESFGIIGFGIEGASTYRLLRRLFPERRIVIVDRKGVANASSFNADNHTFFHTGEDYLNYIGDCGCVFKSPGLQYSIIMPYVSSNAKITSQTEIHLGLLRDKTIGITGTKGKSTTSSLIHEILAKERHSILNGNIGIPFFDCFDKVEPDTFLVSELSCHQLSTANNSPHIAVITNLYEEHLDYYETMDEYIAAKMNIARYQNASDYLIVNEDNNVLRGKVLESDVYSQIIWVTSKKKFPLPNDQGKLWLSNHEVLWERGGDTAHIPLNKRLIGAHNEFDQLIAVTVGILTGISVQSIVDGLRNFKPLANRIELVGTINGARFYNDSISTIPEAAMFAIDALGTVDTIIVGGFDRGINYDVFITYLKGKSQSTIICIGEVGKMLYANLKEYDPSTTAQYFMHFTDAIAHAIKVTPPNGICILSPAAASYDQFSSFEERGRAFKDIVLSYSKSDTKG